MSDGFDDFSKMIEEFLERTDEDAVLEAVEEGVKEFVEDLLRLPKPKSQISKAGYTHLVDAFSYRKNGKEIEVGWGKYYGTMVENGTIKMKAQPHLKETYEKNKTKYEQKIISKIWN